MAATHLLSVSRVYLFVHELERERALADAAVSNDDVFVNLLLWRHCADNGKREEELSLDAVNGMRFAFR